jgi:hypothetical protein
MGSIRRFCAPRMGLQGLDHGKGGNKGPQVLYKYFKDLFHEMASKHHIGPLKGIFDLKWDMGTYRRFYILGMDPGIMTMVKQGKKGPYDLNEASRAHGTKGGLEPLHMPFRGIFSHQVGYISIRIFFSPGMGLKALTMVIWEPLQGFPH